jgi:predicted ATPase
LAEELGVDPGPELRAMHRKMLAAAPEIAPQVRRETQVGNLPAETTSFIGRDRELGEIRRLLRLSRLVTLTGAGGVGKTRLALRAARAAESGFGHGARLVDLAAVTESSSVERAVAESLGLRDHAARSAADAVVDHVRDKRLLLLVDNCEHMVEAVAALVLRLLRAAPGLRVLATSRERLGVPGEYVFIVPCLPVHEPGGGTADAVRLLLDRSAACGATLADGGPPGGLAEKLCRRLDGIPLAIELAAVRLGSLTAAEMLERLGDNLDLLSSPRAHATHRYGQTLTAVMDWSHGLCTPGEQLLWARLSVFAGSFDLRAAEQVCAGNGAASPGDADAVRPGEVVDLLTGLVHKSLVNVDNSGVTTRYRLLETIRQYGMQRLRSVDDPHGLRVRHSDYYRALAARAAADWCGPEEAAWLARLRAELPNVRAALDFCRSRPERAHIGAEIVADLLRTRSWFQAGSLREAREWLDSLAAYLGPDDREPAVLVMAMKVFIACVQGDPDAATALLDAARGLPGHAQATPLAYVEGVHGLLAANDPGSVRQLARVRAEFSAAGHVGDAHMATMFWAMAAVFLGPSDVALRARDVYLAEAETSGGEWARTWAPWCFGLAELRHGEPARALMPLHDSLVRQRAMADNWGPAWGVETLAWTLDALGEHTHAARMLGVAHGLRHRVGVALPGLRPFHDMHVRTVDSVRAALGDDAYAAARSEAAYEDGLALALRTARDVHRLCSG